MYDQFTEVVSDSEENDYSNNHWNSKDAQLDDFSNNSYATEPRTTENHIKKFRNPYEMDRHLVRACHFYDARIYEPDIEAGFIVQRWYAKRMYKRWLRSIRKIPGWEGFRRPPVMMTEEVERNDGSTFVIRKWVPWSKANASTETILRHDANKNRNVPHRLAPQSRVKGAQFGDENFRAKLFTGAMGKHISQLRNSLDMTQLDLAKKINVDVAMVRNIELGGLITFNSEDVLVKNLAKVLGVMTIQYQE